MLLLCVLFDEPCTVYTSNGYFFIWINGSTEFENGESWQIKSIDKEGH
jgi:hypothetical protein